MQNVIEIGQKASQELKSILDNMQISTSVIRIFISSMGCSGPVFNIAKDDEKPSDVSYEFDGIKYVVDRSLVDEFGGFSIDYVEEDGFHGLYVNPKINPHASGCGGCSGCH